MFRQGFTLKKTPSVVNPRGMNKYNPVGQREQLLEQRRHLAAMRIQSIARAYLALKRVKKLTRKVWERAFDPRSKSYFFYNKRTGQSQWKAPKHVELFKKRDIIAAIQMQRVVRGFIGRMKARRAVIDKFARFYDAKVDKFFWMEKSTQKTFWKPSKWLIKYEIPLNSEDQLLYNANVKIKELEDKLTQREFEIKVIRKQRYEELEPQVIADRVDNAKLLERSKDMDRWSIDELCAWFTELKMEEYIPFLFKNRVDGHLFINLSEEDWPDMGIVNHFHTRKLQLILKSFKVRIISFNISIDIHVCVTNRFVISERKMALKWTRMTNC